MCAQIGRQRVNVEAGAVDPVRSSRHAGERVPAVGQEVVHRDLVRGGRVDRDSRDGKLRYPTATGEGRVIRVMDACGRLQDDRRLRPAETALPRLLERSLDL